MNSRIISAVIFYFVLLFSFNFFSETSAEKKNSMPEIKFDVPSPWGIIIDNSNDILVTSATKNLVFVFSPNGEMKYSFGHNLSHPAGIAINQEGQILVSSTYDNTVHIYNSNYEFLGYFGTGGIEHGQFSRPAAIAIDDNGQIFIADPGNKRIQIFDSNGKWIRTIDRINDAYGKFSYPIGIAVDDLDKIYVADYYEGQIIIFDSNGKFLSMLGDSLENGTFEGPINVRITDQEQIFVVEGLSHKIKVFNSNEELVSSFENFNENLFFHPHDIAFDNNGRMLVADYSNNQIQINELSKTIPIKNDGIYLAPLKQLKFGISVNEIKCYEGKSLVYKIDGTPFCVKPTSIEKLVERGWMNIE